MKPWHLFKTRNQNFNGNIIIYYFDFEFWKAFWNCIYFSITESNAQMQKKKKKRNGKIYTGAQVLEFPFLLYRFGPLIVSFENPSKESLVKVLRVLISKLVWFICWLAGTQSCLFLSVAWTIINGITMTKIKVTTKGFQMLSKHGPQKEEIISVNLVIMGTGRQKYKK